MKHGSAPEKARKRTPKSFHEKAGQCQVSFCFSYQVVFAFEPSRLCRHPSIRTLW